MNKIVAHFGLKIYEKISLHIFFFLFPFVCLLCLGRKYYPNYLLSIRSIDRSPAAQVQGLRDLIRADEASHAAAVLAVRDTLRPAMASLQAQKQQLLGEETERQKELEQLQVGLCGGRVMRG